MATAMEQRVAVRISENDQRLMRTMLKLPEDGTLPQSVLDRYAALRSYTDRIGLTHLSGEALALVCLHSQQPVEPDPLAWFTDRWKSGELKNGSVLSVLWRDEWVPCTIVNFNAQSNKVSFLMASDPVERDLPLKRFSLPTPVNAAR